MKVHFILPVTTRKRFSQSTDHRVYKLWSCRNVCHALSYLLDIIYIRPGNKLYRQIVCILMGTNCAPLLKPICYNFAMKELSLLLFLVIIKPILLRHLTQPLDIKTTFLILTILILMECSTKFIHLSCN